MSIRSWSGRAGVAVVLAVAVLGLGVGAGSATVTRGFREAIGPDQAFIGLVNGSSGVGAPAQIRVACPGPIQPGETTHPLAGQQLVVEPPPSDLGDVGNTGPDGNHITAYLGIPPATPSGSGGLATFHRYGAKRPIPTTIDVPCSGSGFVTFMPWPRDPPLSRAFVVPLDYVNIAV